VASQSSPSATLVVATPLRMESSPWGCPSTPAGTASSASVRAAASRGPPPSAVGKGAPSEVPPPPAVALEHAGALLAALHQPQRPHRDALGDATVEGGEHRLDGGLAQAVPEDLVDGVELLDALLLLLGVLQPGEAHCQRP